MLLKRARTCTLLRVTAKETRLTKPITCWWAKPMLELLPLWQLTTDAALQAQQTKKGEALSLLSRTIITLDLKLCNQCQSSQDRVRILTKANREARHRRTISLPSLSNLSMAVDLTLWQPPRELARSQPEIATWTRALFSRFHRIVSSSQLLTLEARVQIHRYCPLRLTRLSLIRALTEVTTLTTSTPIHRPIPSVDNKSQILMSC